MDQRTFLSTAALPALYPLRGFAQTRRTDVTIRGDAFYINGRPTYAGRMFNGKHLLASVDDYVSWGYYDQGQSNYQDGFQSPPVNWTVNTENKKQFFELVKKVTGV